MKICTKCKLEKEFSEFYKMKSSKSGFSSACKVCTNIQCAIWAEKNKEKVRQIKKDWAKNNKEKRKQSCSRWAKNNKESVNKRTRKWVKLNPDKKRKSTKQWSDNNPERNKENKKRWAIQNKEYRSIQYKEWAKNNPDKINLRNRKRRCLKLNAQGSHTDEEWQIIKEKYKFTCPSCFRSEPEIILTEDHICPLSKGGSDSIENIQPLCKSCNSSKSTKNIKFQVVF